MEGRIKMGLGVDGFLLWTAICVRITFLYQLQYNDWDLW